MSLSVYRTRLGIGHNFRLLRPGRHVWRVVDDTVKSKTPAVGGVSLANGKFLPSVLDAPYNATPWSYALGAPLSKPYKLNKRKYTSDDPYDAPLNLADLHCRGGKGQPGWIKPWECWEPFGRVPVAQAEYAIGTWLDPDGDDTPARGRRPLHSGKRAPSRGGSQAKLPPVGTWNVSAGWTFDRLLLPAMEWSTRQTACSWCHGQIPESRTKCCSDECYHQWDLLRRRRKRAVKSGRWPEPRYQKRRWSATRDERADLGSLHLDVRRNGKIRRAAWARKPQPRSGHSPANAASLGERPTASATTPTPGSTRPNDTRPKAKVWERSTTAGRATTSPTPQPTTAFVAPVGGHAITYAQTAAARRRRNGHTTAGVLENSQPSA